MQEHSTLLGRSLGSSDDVYHWTKLGERASNGVQTGQLCIVCQATVAVQ